MSNADGGGSCYLRALCRVRSSLWLLSSFLIWAPLLLLWLLLLCLKLPLFNRVPLSWFHQSILVPINIVIESHGYYRLHHNRARLNPMVYICLIKAKVDYQACNKGTRTYMNLSFLSISHKHFYYILSQMSINVKLVNVTSKNNHNIPMFYLSIDMFLNSKHGFI